MGKHHQEEVESLIRDHGPFLARLALALTSNQTDADDLLHDTWLAAFKAPKAMTSERGWLATVMRRRARAQRRRDRLVALQEDPQAGSGPNASAPEAALVQLEREQLLNAALSRLDEPYRTVIFLRYHEGQKPAAIASQLSVPLKTVKSRLYRGLEMLRCELDRSESLQGADDPRAEWLSALLPLAAAHRPAALLGLLAMKKLLVAAVLLVAFVAAWSVVRSDRQPAPEQGAVVAVQAVDLPAETEPLETDKPETASLTPPPATTRDSIELAAPPTPNSLVVHVTSADGSDEPDKFVYVLALAEPTRGAPRVPVIATTSHKGRARFEYLAPGRYSVSATSAHTSIVAEVREGQESFIEMPLPKRLTVRGTVRLPSGTPAAGAVIWAGKNGQRAPLLPLARADELGNYEVVCAQRYIEIQASLPGYTPSLRQAVAPMTEGATGVREADFDLRGQGASISGKAVDKEGQPIAGAVVQVGTFSPHGLERHQMSSRAMTAVTNEAGEFALPTGFPDGQHTLVALVPSLAPTVYEVALAGTSVEVTLLLGRGAVIEGLVENTDGTPAVGALVTINQKEDFVHSEFPYVAIDATTDEHGRYSLEQVPLSWMHVAAASADDQPLAKASERIEGLQEGEVRTVDLRLEEGYLVAGVVVDKSGLPIEGLRIMASGGLLNGGNVRKVTSDAQGRFRITGLPVPELFATGPQATLTLQAVTFDTTGFFTYGQLDDVKLGATDVRIVADRPTTPDAYITGRVLNGGRPIPRDTRLSVWRDGINRGEFVHMDPVTGEYRAGPLLPGRYHLRVYTANHLHDQTPWIEVVAGQAPRAPDLELLPPSSVRLTFRWEDGADRGSPANINPNLISYLELVGSGTESVALVRDGDALVASKIPPGTYRFRFLNQRSFTPLTKELVVAPGEAMDTSVLVSSARRIVVAAELPFDKPWDEVTLSYGRPGDPSTTVLESMARDDIDKPPYAVFTVLVAAGPNRFVIKAGDGIERSADFSIPAQSPGEDEVYLLEE